MLVLSFVISYVVCFFPVPFSDAIFMNRQPTHEDILNIVHRMYEKDGMSRDEVGEIVKSFPNQGSYESSYMMNKTYLVPRTFSLDCYTFSYYYLLTTNSNFCLFP